MKFIHIVEVDANTPEQADAYLQSMHHVTVLGPEDYQIPPQERITERDLSPACDPPVWHAPRYQNKAGVMVTRESLTTDEIAAALQPITRALDALDVAVAPPGVPSWEELQRRADEATATSTEAFDNISIVLGTD